MEHNAMAMASIASGDTIQQGVSLNGQPSQSSRFQCEKLTESFENTKVSVDSLKRVFLNPRSIYFINASFTADLRRPVFSNYQSPPKVVQNSLPLFLQISVLRL
jgi:hypothetical protein